VRSLILGVRFLLELCALAALGYWGFRMGEGVMRWVLGIGAPLLAAVLWSLFVAPTSTAPVALRIAVEVLVFGSAAIALYMTGHRSLAAIFVVVTVVDRVLDLATSE
jgi:hypothetical protein